MPFGSPKQFVLCGQKDLCSAPLGAGQVQRIEVAEPERFQLLATRDVRLFNLNPARDICEHLPDPAQPIGVGHPPDLELQYTTPEPLYPPARDALQDQQHRFCFQANPGLPLVVERPVKDSPT